MKEGEIPEGDDDPVQLAPYTALSLRQEPSVDWCVRSHTEQT